MLPAIKNYLIQHQAEAGVFAQVATIIAQFVDEPAAQQSAAEILKALGVLSGGAVGGPTKV